jgi:hypothetical protein
MGRRKKRANKNDPEYRIQDPREKRVEMGEKMIFELPRHQEDKRKKKRKEQRKK